MHTGKRYRLRELLAWTTRETAFMTAVAVVPTLLSVGFGWRWLEVPWVPIAMLGTASAFTVGFRNNATYARTWEARQIWGGIVNASRTWGLMVRDLLHADPAPAVAAPAAAASAAPGADATALRADGARTDPLTTRSRTRTDSSPARSRGSRRCAISCASRAPGRTWIGRTTSRSNGATTPSPSGTARSGPSWRACSASATRRTC
jgi:hypothetical protein